MRLSIVIPIKASNCNSVKDFVDNTVKLAKEIKNEKIEIIIANESNNEVYNYMKNSFGNISNIMHFIPEDSFRTGKNDKSNGVYAALNYARYDNILLVDDHFRLTKKTILNLEKYYVKYDVFKCMPNFNKMKLSVLIDLCGMFVINTVDYRKQYCGHLAFKKSQFEKCGFPCRDSLFDEYAFEKHLRNHRYKVGFVRDVPLEATQNISLEKFLEQRVRYAYENISMPFRYTFFLSILPILIYLSIVNFKSALIFSSILTILTIFFAFIGQVIYGKDICPKYTFLLSPLWFWFYPFTSWIAVFYYFSGGVNFGGRKIKKAA